MTVYLESRFATGGDVMAADLLTALLAEIGFESFTETDETLSAYIQEQLFDQAMLDQVISTIPGIHYQTTVKHEPENWNALWESQFDPIRINDNCWIRAPFHPSTEAADLELIIAPQMSFGTGHHATTRLMCTRMLGLDLNKKNVWDYGCGTGVLGILAAKLGADKVYANDTESWAVDNAAENAARNQVGLHLIHGDATQMPADLQFDVILANINRNVLIESANHYMPFLKRSGLLQVSGFLKTDEALLINFYEGHQLKLLDKLDENNWSCMLFG